MAEYNSELPELPAEEEKKPSWFSRIDIVGVRNWIAFFLLGTINNLLFVLIII